jgi:FKBP-type peptidyl-prolyl cis-trans isomerase (trigger factor)
MPVTSPRAALLSLVVAAFASWGCSNTPPEPTPTPEPSHSVEPEKPEPADMASEDLKVGDGQEAKDGDKVKVNYEGRLLKTNFMFDSSTGKGKKPFEFAIGKGGVIKGWDQGVVGMKVGGKRKLTIPSRLAYGDKGQPPKIPPKSTLVFEIELLSIDNPAAAASGSASASASADDKPAKKKKHKH